MKSYVDLDGMWHAVETYLFDEPRVLFTLSSHIQGGELHLTEFGGVGGGGRKDWLSFRHIMLTCVQTFVD